MAKRVMRARGASVFAHSRKQADSLGTPLSSCQGSIRSMVTVPCGSARRRRLKLQLAPTTVSACLSASSMFFLTWVSWGACCSIICCS